VTGINEELAGERAELDAKIDKYKKLLDAKLSSREEVRSRWKLIPYDAARLKHVHLPQAVRIIAATN